MLWERFLFIAGAGMLLGNRALMRVGVRRRADGWRRGAGLLLRDEAATFVLSSFALKLGPADHDRKTAETDLQRRLQEFFAGERTCYVQIIRGQHEDRPTPCDEPSYTLRFQTWIEGPGRFVRPDRWNDDQPKTAALFNIVCRIDPAAQEFDLWARVNHVGIDGVPVQEILTRLESELGISADIVYPSASDFAPQMRARQCSAARVEVIELQTFLDFSPLLAWRKQQNARISETLTFSAALIWRLAKHPAFPGIRVGTTVDVPAIDHLGRGVGVVVIRPGDYFNRADGLAQYAKDFNRQLELIRVRRDSGARTLDAAARVPASLAAALLRRALGASDRAFGSMGLSIIRDAKVFGAPLSDVGQPNGFIAIGSVALDAADGTKVGCVSIKGPATRVSDYPRFIREAIVAS